MALQQAHLLRASVVEETSRNTTRGISGISLAILGERMRMKKVSPIIAISLAEISSPRKGYAKLPRMGLTLSFDFSMACLPDSPALKRALD